MAGEREFTETGNRKQKRFFHLGPPIVLLSFSQVLTVAVLTDLIVYRTCLVSLNINASECSMLQNNSGKPEAVILETKVEQYASIIVMSNFLVRSILPGILSLFLGPWSDRGGRRPIFLAAFCGSILMFVMLSLMSVWNISPWYLLLASIPANIVGGTHIIKLTFVCHISDTAREKNRIVQLALLEASIFAGYILGGFVAPLIYENYGYACVFTTGAMCSTLALGYSYFFVPETVKNTSKESLRGLFKLTFVKEIIVSTLVKQEGLHRLGVWLAIFSITFNELIYKGDQTIKFLFTRARLSWDVQRYSYFDAADAVLRITGLCAVSLRSRFSGDTDTLLAAISFVSALGGAITKSLAWQSWHMYLSVFIGMFGAIISPVMRSLILKFVPAEDAGKVFSLTTLMEMLSTSGGPALYTLIYTNYLPPIYPSPVFLFSVSLFTASIILVFCIQILTKNPRKLISYVSAPQEELQSQNYDN